MGRGKAEDAGGLTPAKDNNAAPYEMGISTQKLHARGPMGLEELCSYQYVITGDGQVR